MPYICLARSDIPDGTIQILDLMPNSSQRHPAYEPPGQTRYLKRPTIDATNFTLGGTLERDVWGMAAYLIDHVEIGGTGQAGGVLTLGAPNPPVAPGDVVLVKGVPFTAVPFPPPPGTQQFDMTVPGPPLVLSFITALTDPISVALMQGAGPPLGGYVGVTAPGPGPDDVTLEALTGPGLPLLGPTGQMAIVPGAPSISIPGNQLVLPGTTQWSIASLLAVTNALLARVDNGQSLTLAAINAILAPYGAELTNAGGSQSTGSVADVLSIMAGRQYYLPMRNPITGAMNQIMSGGVWNPAGFGGFTTQVLVNGDVMAYGEWKPANIGGDIENRPVGPYRHTFDGGAFQRSLLNGNLAVFAGVAGMPPVTLFPNHSPTPLFPWDFQGPVQYPQVTVSRVVTVYDDTGAVLA